MGGYRRYERIYKHSAMSDRAAREHRQLAFTSYIPLGYVVRPADQNPVTVCFIIALCVAVMMAVTGLISVEHL